MNFGWENQVVEKVVYVLNERGEFVFGGLFSKRSIEEYKLIVLSREAPKWMVRGMKETEFVAEVEKTDGLRCEWTGEVGKLGGGQKRRSMDRAIREVTKSFSEKVVDSEKEFRLESE